MKIKIRGLSMGVLVIIPETGEPCDVYSNGQYEGYSFAQLLEISHRPPDAEGFHNVKDIGEKYILRKEKPKLIGEE